MSFSASAPSSSSSLFKVSNIPGGVLPIMAYTGRLRPKGVPFQASGIKKAGISQVEVYKRVGKSVI